MKAGVLSDTHINSVTDDLISIYDNYLSDVDVIFHAGDIVSSDVVAFLDRDNFHGVAGNMDPYDVRGVLPVKKVVSLESVKIGLIHGWGASGDIESEIYSEFEDVDVIIYGHTHIPANHFKNNILFFNPGTAIGYKSNGPHTIGILDINQDQVKGEIINL